MNIINLTPHDVVMYRVEDTITEGKTVMVAANAAPRCIFPKSGTVARARQTETVTGTIDGIEVLSMSYGEVEDLPEPQEDTMYIVSTITAMAARAHGRSVSDLLLVAHAVRDNEGRIVGCTAFSQL